MSTNKLAAGLVGAGLLLAVGSAVREARVVRETETSLVAVTEERDVCGFKLPA